MVNSYRLAPGCSGSPARHNWRCRPLSLFSAMLDSTLATSGDTGPGIGENGDAARSAISGIVISGERGSAVEFMRLSPALRRLHRHNILISRIRAGAAIVARLGGKHGRGIIQAENPGLDPPPRGFDVVCAVRRRKPPKPSSHADNQMIGNGDLTGCRTQGRQGALHRSTR